MSSLFYYGFALSLIPIGMLVDRIELKKIFAYSVWLCALGTGIFAISATINQACVGRFLMGVGGASAFVGTMRFIAIQVPRDLKGLLSGLTIASAMLGAIFGQTVLGALVKGLGWRDVMIYMTILGIIIGILMMVFMNIKSINTKDCCIRKIKHDLCIVVGNINAWRSALYASIIYIPLPVFAGLWGIPYLVKVHNLTHTNAFFACSLVWVGMGLGSPFFGWLSDGRFNRHHLMMFSAIIIPLIMLFALYYIDTNKTMLLVSMFLIGCSSGAYALAFVELRNNTPAKVSGLAVAFVMTIVMMAVAITTQFIGFILYIATLYQSSESGMMSSQTQYKIAIAIIPALFIFSIYLSSKLLMHAKDEIMPQHPHEITP